MGQSLFLVVSNLPCEATEDELYKFMHTLNIVNLVINDGVATMKVQSVKDVREAMTYD